MNFLKFLFSKSLVMGKIHHHSFYVPQTHVQGGDLSFGDLSSFVKQKR